MMQSVTMLKIKAQVRGEHLHVECAACGKSVLLENLRWVGGVPKVKASCPGCDEHDELKLDVRTWASVVRAG
jgi:ribosomal protein S27E